jgi:hypothetical protein
MFSFLRIYAILSESALKAEVEHHKVSTDCEFETESLQSFVCCEIIMRASIFR